MDNIEKYIISTLKKYSDEDLELCYNIIEENSYITSEMIDKDTVLGLKYSHWNMKKRLLDEMFKHFDNLTEMKTGQGNKRYIFKIGDEKKINKVINQQRKTRRKAIKDTDINEIKEHLLNNYLDKTISVIDFRDIFSETFNIKSQHRVKSILKQLNRMGVLSNVSIGNFRVNNDKFELVS